jgi:hypothetical protein
MSKGNQKPLGSSERVNENCWEITNTHHQPLGQKAELSSSHWQKHGNSCLFPMKCFIFVHINKNQRHIETFLKLSGAPFLIIFCHIIPL